MKYAEDVCKFFLNSAKTTEYEEAQTFRQQLYLHAAVSDDLWHNAIEGQLLVKGLDALLFRVVKLPGAIKVQNVPEHFRVPVKEVLLCVFIVEKLLL